MKRLSRPLGLIAFGLWITLSVRAQGERPLPLSAPFEAALAAQTRTLTGQPGANYWVNRARYDLEARLDPAARRIEAEGQIVYFNQSPDTLRSLVIHLYQNLYKPDAKRDDQLKAKELTEGLELGTLVVAGDTIRSADTSYRHQIDGTNLIIELSDGLLPGDSVQLRADWAFTISAGGSIRMGTYGTHAYFVAYWYPQVAVYDDVFGWDTVQHTGLHEFYQDQVDFRFTLHLPDSLLAWSTGVWQNPDSILTPTYLRRYQEAMVSDSVVRIVAEEDYRGDSVIVQPDSMQTWRFVAQEVPDLAFAVSDYYYWDASSVVIDSPGRRVLTQACYQPEARDFYQVAAFARDIIDFMSDSLPGVAYPYPVMTVFNGSVEGFGGGMEFPMIVNDGSAYSFSSAFRLTHHELAHTYFPFLMGINEHRYAFMDEGWASLLPTDLMALRGYSSSPMYWNVASYAGFAGSEAERPLMTNARELTGQAYGVNAYSKPATAYHLLRGVMGDSLFKVALRTYIERWRGKHPLPYDFFYTFDAVAGESLAWFWQPWFFETPTPDLALRINQVKRKKVSLLVLNEGGLPLPIHLRFTLKDGSKERIDFPASVWKDGERSFLFEEKFSDKVIEIDLGRGDVPDVDDSDNSFDVGD